MLKLLFIVNGLGLGNSTRCDAIITRLIKRGLDIDVLTSGNGLQYFKERPDISNLFEFESFYYASKHGELSGWRTILSLPNFLRILPQQCQHC